MWLCLGRKLRFPSQSAGAFTALAALELTTGSVSGGELESILSSRCPQLKKLALEVVTITLRPAAGDNRALCIRSDSLEQLKIIANIYRHDLLQVATPELKSLFLNVHCNLHIIAPKLSKLYWHCNSYDPDRHRLEEVPRHLRRLRVAINTPLGGNDAAVRDRP
ncbi:hypothetical protein HU200_054598 [Digitaria exilis]|uniref:F-box/LRR-repeat protein 15/At3g58940/PEG3-like LRR domain-containing protein n=1 Tax=Digitaria exilis TaxID=1010633 RepID=A0A835AI86_9POAL|nr:hypothetical protein HU200_054598 [Digitaria exilis]